MKENTCIHFLQQILPKLHMRWKGFRKVSKQVCKRINRRLEVLGLDDFTAYHKYLERNKDEWLVLDGMCRITISRFYRDRGFFECISQSVLSNLTKEAQANSKNIIRVWSVGAASGEEAYTLLIIWEQCFSQRFPGITLSIIATDSDEHMLKRARTACYTFGSLKNLPESWLKEAFEYQEKYYCLKKHYKSHVQFIQQDIRHSMPVENFDLILCRNLVFTYFDKSLQYTLLQKIEERLRVGGYLAIGIHESLPEGFSELIEVSKHNRIYKKMNSKVDIDGKQQK